MQFTALLLMGGISLASAQTLLDQAQSSTSPVIPLAPIPQQNTWTMTTWSGPNCTGSELFWSMPDLDITCTDPPAPISIYSLAVTNTFGCTTSFFPDIGCDGPSPSSIVHVAYENSCYGYADGGSIGSFFVSC